MSTTPISMPSSSSSASTGSSSSSSASAQAAMDALGNPDTFLQLLVAQLQYQDPESPADGTTFVTQLATFAGVEEQSAMRSDLDSINGIAEQWSSSQTAASSATSGANSTGSTNNTGATTDTGSTSPGSTTPSSN